MTPRVSVLMPIRNGSRFLQKALDSLIAQSLSDWELVAVLDGPDPESELILHGRRDARIRCLKLNEPHGIAGALNTGLQAARAGLIARFDQDDECLPDRFRLQVVAMEAWPNLGLLGTAAIEINEGGNEVGRRLVPTGPRLRRALLIRNRFIHPSVMMRRLVLDQVGGYRDQAWLREDYELWLRIAAVAEIDNLPEALIRYRLHPGQASRIPLDWIASRIPVRQSRRALGQALHVSWPVRMLLDVLWEAGQLRGDIRRALG